MSPREYRLYHYTECEKLLSILDDSGFGPAFCAEDYSWMTGGSPCYLMVPMVCFCDMPAELSREHQKAYGSSTIGLRKDWGKKRGLTPVLYVCDGSPVTNIFRPLADSIRKGRLNASEFGSFWGLLPYLKPVTGFFPGGEHNGRHYTECKDFDEEMEWRFVPTAFQDFIYSVSLFEANERQEAKRISEQTRPSLLGFTETDVEVIIVPTDAVRMCIIGRLPVYKGRVKTWPEIDLK